MKHAVDNGCSSSNSVSLYTSFAVLKFSFRGVKDQREMGISCMPSENKLTQKNLSYRHLEEGALSAVLPLFPVFFPLSLLFLF